MPHLNLKIFRSSSALSSHHEKTETNSRRADHIEVNSAFTAAQPHHLRPWARIPVKPLAFRLQHIRIICELRVPNA